MNFNKACELEDFANPELAGVIRDICAYVLPHFPPEFPRGAEHRKDWEVAMAVQTLRHFGALRPDATILGVAAGTEDTLFYLTRHARQVFATDRYYAAGNWDGVAPTSMLLEPELSAPYEFDRNRLVVQHMDARDLRFPDDTFDGIFSSGSIEHVGELLDVAHAAYEMGRVLKPGGVVSLSTELLLSGPPGGIGWPGSTLLLSEANLRRYIIEASGLELVDELDLDISPATMATQREIAVAIKSHQDRMNQGGELNGALDHASWDFPHLVMVNDGYAFGSVHLALRKTATHPVTPNQWARPVPAVYQSIRAYNMSQLRGGGAVEVAAAGVGGDAAGTSAEPATAAPERLLQELPDRIARLEAAGAESAGMEAVLGRAVEELEGCRRHAEQRLDDLGRLETEMDGRLQESLIAPAGPRPSRWVDCPVVRPDGLQFTVVVDPDMDDFIALGYLAGDGHLMNPELVDLMLVLTRPGDWVIDLGAHLGSFTLAAAAAGRRVIAVEGSPTNAALLQASVIRSGFSTVQVIHAAAVDTPGTVQFCPRGPWGHVATAEVGLPSVGVPGVRVDDLHWELGAPPVSFVKMDIEGAEASALRGMTRLLGQLDSPPVLYEVNCHQLRFFGLSGEALVKNFDDLGFSSYLVNRPRLIHARSSEFCPQTVGDYLALKRRPDQLANWRFEAPLTPAERVTRIAADCASHNVDVRASMATRLAGLGDGLRAQPAILEALRKLRDDPEAVVRKAAAWSAAGSPATAGTGIATAHQVEV